MGLPHVRISDGREIAPQLDLRERLHLYAGVRSVKAIAGLPLPLADPRALEVDFVLVRESTERLFAERESGTMKPAGEARDSLVISRAACERPFDFTFALARVGGPAEDRAA
ncbi:MAG: isocitrate/isopropylmalate family dehydrogenase [Actinomycetia bacterium]|nr:isocitrate/isopropylmalate family dehydrogenase [Actinomycetes bacterium]